MQRDISYYTYPTSVSRGYWAQYPSTVGLSAANIQRRAKWLGHVEDCDSSAWGAFVRGIIERPEDSSTIQELIAKHGVFSRRFFERSVRRRVVQDLLDSPWSWNDLAAAIAEAWDRDSLPVDKTSLTFWTIELLHDGIFRRFASDGPAITGLDNWTVQALEPTKCHVCESEYRPADLPDWLYFGANGDQGCCLQCPLPKPLKGELHGLVPAFVESCGFIPRSDAGLLNHSFNVRVAAERRAKMMVSLVAMGGLDHVKKKFGSWFRALAATGCLPDGALATARGVRCVAEDGHECHSLDEQLICNWLFKNGIPHEREPHYPAHPIYNKHGLRRADWKVGDTYIEYFGLAGDKAYDLKTDEKMTLAMECRLKLIPIYPEDLNSLDAQLASLIP